MLVRSEVGLSEAASWQPGLQWVDHSLAEKLAMSGGFGAKPTKSQRHFHANMGRTPLGFSKKLPSLRTPGAAGGRERGVSLPSPELYLGSMSGNKWTKGLTVTEGGREGGREGGGERERV